MKKAFLLLFAVITVLGICSVFLVFHPKILKKPIILYFEHKAIHLWFSDIKINSINSITLKKISLKTNGIKAKVQSLTIHIKPNRHINIFLKNPTITYKTKNTKKGHYKLFSGIDTLKIDNLTLKKESEKTYTISKCNLLLHKNRLTGRGLFKTKNLTVDIIKTKSELYLKNNSIQLEDILIKSTIYQKNGLKLEVLKTVHIDKLTINLQPFIINIHRAKGAALVSSKHISARFNFYAYLVNNQLTLDIKHFKSKQQTLNIEDISLSSNILNPSKLTILFNKLSMENRFVIVQNSDGKIFINRRKIKGSIQTGEILIYDKWYLNFNNFPLDFHVNTKQKNIHVVVKNLIEAKINSLKQFDISSKRAKELFKIFKESSDNKIVQKTHISNSSQITLHGVLRKKSLLCDINLKTDKIDIQGLSLNGVNIKIPIICNQNTHKKGYIKIANISFKNNNLRLNSTIDSYEKKIIVYSKFSKTDSIYIKPFAAAIDLKNKTLLSKFISTIKTNFAKINFNLSKIYIENSNIKTKGSVALNLFGGKANIKNIQARDIFGIPVVGMDVDFKHISLRKITKRTNFGLITGYIQGYIHNLKLVNFKLPLSFDALVKTQETKNGSKKITLKAIKNISKISGGYTNIVVPFFKNFPYSTIGLKAALKNNLFSICGLYKKGNKDYIVKKGFLFGVSVVNMNKNNSISWEDMVERIRRVLKENSVEVK